MPKNKNNDWINELAVIDRKFGLTNTQFSALNFFYTTPEELRRFKESGKL